MDYRAQDLQAGIAYQFNPLWLSTFVFTSKAAEGVPSKSGKDFLKKDDSLAPGQILCTLCNTGINYGARGVAAIKAHVNSKKTWLFTQCICLKCTAADSLSTSNPTSTTSQQRG